jgi:drug/metabolite transporter (DMT)-like permease
VFYLIAVSAIWSVSFGLLKEMSMLNPNLVALLRLTVATLLFLPFFRPSKIPARAAAVFFFIGMLEYGAMQLCLIFSLHYIDAWQAALMTLFTPVYIVAIDSIQKRRIDWVFLSCALLTVIGAAIAMIHKGCVPPKSLIGCALAQAADIFFAIGILLYRNARARYADVKDHEIYALLFLGAFVLSLACTLFTGGFADLPSITGQQWWVILYLGLIASGVCLYFWNVGATKVSTGTLAALSNLKVPMAVVASLVIFGERAGSWMRLMIGAFIMVIAVAIVHNRAKKIA